MNSVPPVIKNIISDLGERFTYKQEWLPEWEKYYCEPSYIHEFTINRPCVLVGSRGSGKTTTLRCLSYQAQKTILGEVANNLERWQFFGIFQRVDIGVSNVFSGPELDPASWQKLFIHHTNLQMVLRLADLLKTIQDDFKVDLGLDERTLTEVGTLLSIEEPIKTLEQLRQKAADSFANLGIALNNIGEVESARVSALGQAFSLLASKLKSNKNTAGINLFYLIDEFENLNEDQQRVINTLIKHCAPNYFIKIGVRNYGFRTKLTLAEDEYLSHPADYVSLSIFDRFPSDDYKKFALGVVKSRLEGLSNFIQPAEFFEKINLTTEFELHCRASTKKNIADNWSSELDDRNEPSMLFKAFLMGYLSHKGVDSSQAALYAKNNKKQIVTAYGNYSFSVVLNELRGLKSSIKKRYSGINTLADLSGRNIRYFMELVFRAILQEVRKSEEFTQLSVDAQTISVLEVGEEYLRDIEVRGLTGKSVNKLILAMGAVFEGLSRDVFAGKPEATQFIVVHDDSTTEEIQRAEDILESAVMHGGLLESPLTKAEGPGVVKNKEYRIFPLFCPFLGFSHRQKRRIKIHAREVCVMASDPDEGARLVSRRISRKQNPLEDVQGRFL